MADQNNFCCTGRLGDAPTELRYTAAGKAVCNANIAISGIGQDSTTWIRANFWERTAEIANEFLRKGSRVALSGRLQQRTWETQDGQNRKEMELVVGSLTLLDPKPDDQGNRQNGGGQRQQGQQQGRQQQHGGQRQQQQPQRSRQQPSRGQQQQAPSGWGSDQDHYPADDLSADEIPF